MANEQVKYYRILKLIFTFLRERMYVMIAFRHISTSKDYLLFIFAIQYVYIGVIWLLLLVEIGTFTGYTSLTIALALPSDGELVTCDITDEYVRQDIWIKAGVGHKINLQIRPALETLEDLLKTRGPNSFDFVFIDGDKANYAQYYELSYQLIRPNGLIAIDNTLWNGRVLNENDQSIETKAIRQTNEIVKNDNRVDVSFLRLGDGTTFCRKK